MAQELRRKGIHLFGLIIPIIYYFTDQRTVILIASACTAIAVLIELLKWLSPSFLNLFVRIFSPMLRARERKGGFTGATYYLIGSFLCILVFEKTLAIVCICFLILGDLAAAVIGKQWGRTKILSHKSLEGSLACFVVCVLVALLMKLHPVIGFTGAIVATLIELIPLGLDDNVTMPFISGIVMHVMINNWQF
jgi:dolichol kinase